MRHESGACPWNGGDADEGRSGESVKAGPAAGVLAVPAARLLFSPFPQSLGFVWFLNPNSCDTWLRGQP